MTIGTLDNDTLFLGLSAANVHGLKGGFPIYKDLEQIIHPSVLKNIKKLVIHYGETEQAIVDEIKSKVTGGVTYATEGGRESH